MISDFGIRSWAKRKVESGKEFVPAKPRRAPARWKLGARNRAFLPQRRRGFLAPAERGLPERSRFRKLRRPSSDGADEEKILVAGAAAVVALLHFFQERVPGGFGKDLGGFPLLGVTARVGIR